MHLRTGDYNPHFDGGHRDINGYFFVWIGCLLAYGTGEHSDTTGDITNTNTITVKI